MTTNLTHSETLVANMVDENLAQQARLVLEEFFTDENELVKPIKFSVSSDGKSFDMPPEIMQMLFIVLKKIGHNSTVKVAGKNAHLLLEEAQQIFELSDETFKQLMDSGEIPVRENKKMHYILMNDIVNYKIKQYKKHDKFLSNLVAERQAEAKSEAK